MKFSLILAVYNVEKYLEDCLYSVCNQDMPSYEYEIICVDDGSSDQSQSIIKKFQSKYSNIKCISQDNHGVSSARNAGLKAAEGEYIWFIDGDDLIMANCLKTLYELLIKYQLNIICFQYRTVTETYTHRRLPSAIPANAPLIDASEYMPSLWSKVFKRYIITDYFEEHLIYGEDDEFVFPLILKNMPVKEYCQVLYYYRQRGNSITHNHNDEMNQLRIENTLWRINHFSEQKDFYMQYESEKQIELIHTYEYNLYAVVLINLAKMKPNSNQQISYINELKILGGYPYPIQWKRMFKKKSSKSLKMKYHQLLAELVRLFLPVRPFFKVFNHFYYLYLKHKHMIGE